MPDPRHETRKTFTCENCDQTLPVTDEQPLEIGMFLDETDFGLWCAACVEKEL